MTMYRVPLVVMLSLVATAHAKVNLEALAPPTDKATYTEWLAEQSSAVRAAIANSCAKEYTWSSLCNGIGPFGLEEPPSRADEAARAQWEASLSPAARAWVTKACAGPKHLTTTLCGYDLPSPPKPGETLSAWRARLTRNERGMVDDHCDEMTHGTDEYCDGIGPLHLPSPPSTGRGVTRGASKQDEAAEQAAWDAWYRKLTRAQRAYYHYWCSGSRGGVSDLCGGTPLVLVLDGQPVQYTAAREDSRFAIDGMSPLRTDWPTARTPWIARDVDGDGVIMDGSELFGSGTLLPDGRRASDGFVALAALDDNSDGVIDAHDRAWGELLAWSDRDGDRRGTGSELAPLSSLVESISLRHEHGARCDGRGNCERLRASAMRRGIEVPGAVVDVQLLVQPPAGSKPVATFAGPRSCVAGHQLEGC